MAIDLGARHVYTALPALVRWLRELRPKVILSDKDRVNRTALLARKLSGIASRLVLSSGTTISIDLRHRGRFERWLQRNSMGRLYPLADSVIVTSRGVAEDMAAYTGLGRERITVVPSPVVPDALFEDPQPRPDHPWFGERRKPVILAVGELGRRKGFDMLLQAFALLRERVDARLVILGAGRQREELVSIASRLGISRDVDFAGFVSNPYAFMAHADVMAFTSRWEGLGFVLIEAMSMGTPVVATDCPSGPAEILDGGRYGPLVPIDHAEQMAEGLAATLRSPPDSDSLRTAVRRYSVSAATDAYLDVFGLPRWKGL